MKLQVELKDDKFVFSWEVGTSKISSQTPLSVESYITFCELVKRLSDCWNNERDIEREDQLGRLYYEKYIKEGDPNDQGE